MSGMVGQIIKTGGTNAITGGTNTVKICPASSSVAVFKRKLRPLCFS